ncbi:unnamed protein product [Onchocerca flexuosa]|uniref:Transposase n=1 Tax=Onchocerca flexuosa TaxID=387005 RepID=A0A183HHT5_9BILA|nr:unnamed protein product [Onchocerca flexuosa]
MRSFQVDTSLTVSNNMTLPEEVTKTLEQFYIEVCMFI